MQNIKGKIKFLFYILHMLLYELLQLLQTFTVSIRTCFNNSRRSPKLSWAVRVIRIILAISRWLQNIAFDSNSEIPT